MEIALDFDDVICAFGDGLREAIEFEYGVKVPPFMDWDVTSVLDPIVGKPWFSEWLRERPERWVEFRPMPGAIGGIQRLRDDGHYIEVVTAKPVWAEFVIWEWFAKHRPPVHRVTIVDVGVPKTEATEAELLVDDNAENVRDWLHDGRDAILFSQSHNAREEVNAPRVKSWPELVELVRMEEAVKL